MESQEKILGHRVPYNGMGVSGPGFLNAVNEKIELRRYVVGTWTQMDRQLKNRADTIEAEES